jgi:hypothetical protein
MLELLSLQTTQAVIGLVVITIIGWWWAER